MPTLRQTLIHVASDLPAGDPTRRKLLAALAVRTARLGKKTDAKGIVIGYGAGPGGGAERELMMFGPLMSVTAWTRLMKEATPYGYNEFDASTVGRYFQKFGIRKVHPAREYSVAAYLSLDGLSAEDVVAVTQGSSMAYADEADVYEGRPDGKWLGGRHDISKLTASLAGGVPGKLWLRLWWD